MLNPSDKTRGSNYSDYDGSMEKCKKYKWWIIGGSVIVIICVVLGVLLGTHEIGPGPPSPPPPPPLPPWEAYNPYNNVASYDYKSKKVGSASANLEAKRRLESGEKFLAYPPDAFKLAQDDFRVRHAEIPTGVNNPFVDHMLWEIG